MSFRIETVQRYPDPFNRVKVTGTIVRSGKYDTFGDDLDLRYPENGIPVVRFDLRIYRLSGSAESGESERAYDSVRVLLWGDLAEKAAQEGPDQILVGDRVYLVGRFQSFSRVYKEEAVTAYNFSQRLFKLTGERPEGEPVKGADGEGHLLDWERLRAAFPEIIIPDLEEQARGRVRYVLYPDGRVQREETITHYEVHAHFIQRLTELLGPDEQDLNEVVLLGRVRSADFREVGEDGTPRLHVCLSVPRPGKGKPGRQKYDHLHVYGWWQTALAMRDHVAPGDILLCRGRLQSREFSVTRTVRRKGKEIVLERTHTTYEVSAAHVRLYRLQG